MRTFLVAVLVSGASVAHAGLLARCLRFLQSEASSPVWTNGSSDPTDLDDAIRLAWLEEKNPWPERPIERRVLEFSPEAARRRFLEVARELALTPLFGFEVPFAMSAVRLNEEYDGNVVSIAAVPQRVLPEESLPSVERSALRRLLHAPESQRRYGEGFRESAIVVGYLRHGGAVQSSRAFGDEWSVSREQILNAVSEVEALAADARELLLGATIVHVHPEANIPLTTGDVGMVRDVSRLLRSKLPRNGFVAIVAGSAGSDGGAVFRYAARPPRRFLLGIR